MSTLIFILHIVVCFLLIFIVLIQSSKGAQMGAAFGGSSQTVFGSRGATTFLSKFTTITAIVFMVTSLLLAFMAVKKESIVKPTVTTTAPAEGKVPLDKAGVKPVDEGTDKTADTPSKEPTPK